MRFILIIALALASIANINAAEGRRTAAVGGFVVGAVAGFLVRDAMVAPAPRERVVYVEREPAPVVIEREVIVYREAPPPRTIIIVEGERRHRHDEVIVYPHGNGMGWRPAPVRPFPQGHR